MERGETKGTLETTALRDPRVYPEYKDLREYREYQETWEVKDREGLRVWRVDRDSRETWGHPDHLGETPVAPLLRQSEGRGRWRWCLAPPDPRDQWDWKVLQVLRGCRLLQGSEESRAWQVRLAARVPPERGGSWDTRG